MTNFKPSPDYSILPAEKPALRVVLLLPDGSERDLTPEEINPKNLRLLLCGGWFEMVTVLDFLDACGPHESIMFVDEEGLLKNLPRNPAATALYQRNVRSMYPGESKPFAVHDARIRAEAKRKGMSVIDINPPTLDLNNPHIAGNAIWFVGRNGRAVDAMLYPSSEDESDGA